jgi:hypothetical protein
MVAARKAMTSAHTRIFFVIDGSPLPRKIAERRFHGEMAVACGYFSRLKGVYQPQRSKLGRPLRSQVRVRHPKS